MVGAYRSLGGEYLAIISSSRWHLHSGHFLHDSLDGENAPAWHAADPYCRSLSKKIERYG